jgi:predicted metal-dependent hydrolase
MPEAIPPEGCRATAPAELVEGIARFNRGEYHPCHEILEALWRRTPGAHRELYQGIIQLAIALHHTRNLNHDGAITMYAKALVKLAAFEPECQGVDVAGLMAQGREAQSAVAALGAEGLSRFDWSRAPRIVLRSPAV